MEKINDILNNIKDRLSNPLIFSFVCSWLVINWQITVALIWYDPKQIANEKCISIFDFINDKLNIIDYLVWPLVMALLYTFAMPIIKNGIKAFYSWTSKWGENWNLKILNEGKISIDKYLKLRSDYKNAMQKLEEVISEESEYIDRYNKLNSDFLNSKNKLNETAKKLSDKETFIQESRDVRILDGTWEVKQNIQGEKITQNVQIIGGGYNIVSDFGNKDYKFDIRNFYYDNIKKDVFFVKEGVAGQDRYKSSADNYRINMLKFEGKDKLIGMEDRLQIEYIRKS